MNPKGDHTLKEPPQQCNAITKNNMQCKNNGRWQYRGECYCYTHAPKKHDTCVICLMPVIEAYYLA